MNEEKLRGWKSDTQPLPEPIEIDDVNEEELIIKKVNNNEK